MLNVCILVATELEYDQVLRRRECGGIRVEDIKEPLMREIRYLDKLIDEVARGKAFEKILRK